MGGDTGKIIGYVAMAAAVAYTGYAMFGKAALTSAAPVGAKTSAGAGLTAVPAGTSAVNPGTLALGKGGSIGLAPSAGAGAGGFGSGGTLASTIGTGAKGSYAYGATPVNYAGGAGAYGAGGSTLTQTAANPGFMSTLANKAGTYISENPLSSYFIGSGMLNQMTAPGMPEYPMADFTSLQAQKTYDQGLDLMSIEELTFEMERTDISPEQRNAIGRAMQAKGLSDQRIYESRVRGAMGGERQAGINEAVKQFNEDTNISDEELANQTAAIYAMYNSKSDPVYDKAETQLKQKQAQRGLYNSRGSDDATSAIAEARARTALENQTKAEAEALRRNAELTKMRQQGVNALLTGANYGDVSDRWTANFNENNRRYQLADLKGARQDNYSTSLLGLQGGQNYDLGNYQAQQNAANAQALQGLEMTRLGMRGFGDLVPIGSRRLYDSYYGI